VKRLIVLAVLVALGVIPQGASATPIAVQASQVTPVLYRNISGPTLALFTDTTGLRLTCYPGNASNSFVCSMSVYDPLFICKYHIFFDTKVVKYGKNVVSGLNGSVHIPHMHKNVRYRVSSPNDFGILQPGCS
jgi:hypothetical protein